MFEVKTGTMAVEVLGITNFAELQAVLGEKTVSEVVCTKENKQELVTTAEHYKKIRTPLKKTRAEANKLMTAKTKEILGEFDTAIQLVSEYIEPYETAVSEYEENARLQKIAKKKAIFEPQIEEANIAISDINEGFGKHLIDHIAWSDDWANWSEDKIKLHIEEEIEKAVKKRNEISNNIRAVQILCKSLKSDYDLKSDLNYELILEDRIYTSPLDSLEARLEKFAMQQQENEAEAEQRATEEAERKAKLEAERVEKERIEAERKAIQEAEEKVRQEERNKIEAEKTPEPIETTTELTFKDITLFFQHLNNKQAKLMLQYFKDNNIKFEVI